MAEMIKRHADGRVFLALESSEGFAAEEIAAKRLGATEVRCCPLALLSPETAAGDLVLACRAGSDDAKTAAKLLGLKLPAVVPSGYHIGHYAATGGNVLLICGGDLFGLLAGLTDALRQGELNRRGFRYRGGTRTETPAFPLRYYWTWDHSTNWCLDDPGMQVNGCANRYLKRPETFVEDYRRLIDHCLEMRFNGVLIWGFLRDAHGGVHAATEVARYAAQRGVAILPGIGTTGYGGVYYEGAHPCNLETYLAAHPERGNQWADGKVSQRESSPYVPENRAWIAQCLSWLCHYFPIGGVNLENNDLMVDHSKLAQRERAKIKSGEADHFKDQYFAYHTALATLDDLRPHDWHTYATYSGFGRGQDLSNAGADVGCEPYFAKRMPPSAIAQWTITGMVRPEPVPLRAWLSSGTPAGVYDNPRWPRDLRPPTPRSAGFLHQASQWSHIRRNQLALGIFAEGCLRSHEAGLEGLSVHGEVSSRSLVWWLNYLAMRHWTYHPVSSLEEFAVMELASRVGGEPAARHLVEALALLEEGRPDDARKLAGPHFGEFYPGNFPARGELTVSRIWGEVCEWCRSPTPARINGFTDVL